MCFLFYTDVKHSGDLVNTQKGVTVEKSAPGLYIVL
jgi:hypothetical protein